MRWPSVWKLVITSTVTFVVLVFFLSDVAWPQYSKEPPLTCLCHNASSPRSAQKKIILMSYMRSDSTYTGNVFTQHHNVHYMFEPLSYTWHEDVRQPGKPISLRLSGTFGTLPPDPPRTLDYLLKLLRCNFTARDLQFYKGRTLARSIHITASCLSDITSLKHAAECFHVLRDSCQQAEAVVTKVFRLQMWEVDELLACDHDLKVIHLLHDPRAVAQSRKVTGYSFDPETYCSRLSDDEQLSRILQRKYPERLLTLRYEDLVQNTTEITRLLYKFSGISWMPEIESRIKVDSMLSNPHQLVSKWRQISDFQTADQIQRLCKSAMGHYGYKNVNNISELRNLNLSVFSHRYNDVYYKIYVL